MPTSWRRRPLPMPSTSVTRSYSRSSRRSTAMGCLTRDPCPVGLGCLSRLECPDFGPIEMGQAVRLGPQADPPCLAKGTVGRGDELAPVERDREPVALDPQPQRLALVHKSADGHGA